MPVRVAACLVTRGNVPMDDIFESIPDEWEIVLWDNQKRQDMGVYGRYAAIELTDAELIFVQDDDCVLEPGAFDFLQEAWRPGALVANMPDQYRPNYPDSCLVGFGALFERSEPARAFARRPADATFLLTCDVYFTTLTERILVDVPFRHQPWASAPDRMWKQPEHVPTRFAALEAARSVRES